MKFQKTCGESECIKNLQRNVRLTWMKENQKNTPWFMKDPSYPERFFLAECRKRELEKKYHIIPELPFFPYHIDFAFMNEKVAVEIDGSQHLIERQKKSDQKKDKILTESGWVVVRFSASQITQVANDCFQLLNTILENRHEGKTVGIEKYESKKEKNKREINEQRKANGGKTNKELARSFNQRKVVRPDDETLKKEVFENGFSATGRKYKVSDNTIRKWVRN